MEHVEQTPRQDDDVVDVEEERDDRGAESDTCSWRDTSRRQAIKSHTWRYIGNVKVIVKTNRPDTHVRYLT